MHLSTHLKRHLKRENEALKLGKKYLLAFGLINFQSMLNGYELFCIVNTMFMQLSVQFLTAGFAVNSKSLKNILPKCLNFSKWRHFPPLFPGRGVAFCYSEDSIL
jgi:hypothetical protein